MIRKNIGDRVKELRISRCCMNQEEFAKKIGWDKTYLSRVESGKQNITIDNLMVICNGLGLSFREFFNTFDKPIKQPGGKED